MFYCFWRGSNYGVKVVDTARRHSSIAKITCPILSGILPRKRLFQQLENNKDRPIKWVSGPPGCGKTTLVASYLKAAKIPCLWYQVDEGDSDISTFFYYMGLAAKKAAPLKRKSLPLLTPEYMLGLPTFTLRYFENLFSRLKSTSVIVFDNYQHVPVESRFHEIVSYGLGVIPEEISVIAISRREPPPQLVGLRANNKISFLGWKDLSLTLDESTEILEMKGLTGLTDESILQMHEKIKGWVAGLILMMERQKISHGEYESLDKLAPKEIFDYFAKEILDRTDSETQDFLLRTAFLPRMTVEMAAKLTGISHSEKLLSDLSRNHFFTEKTSHAETSYQYHPLFREFLSSRAKKLFLSDEITTLRQTAAALLEKSGQLKDAINLLMETNNWDEVIRLILKHAQSFLSTGRFRTLEEYLNKIPKELCDKVPWLLYWLGISRMPFNPAESRQHFERAFQLFNEQGDTAGVLLSWSASVDSILNEWNDFTLLDSWIEWLDHYTKNNLPFPSPEIEAQVATSMAGALSWRQPQRNDVREWMEKALLLSQQSPNMNIRLQIYGHAIHYYNWMGEMTKCGIIAGDLKRMSESRDTSPLIFLVSKYSEAMMYCGSAMTYKKSLQAVSEGLEIAEKSGVHICDPVFFAQGVYGSFNLGDMAIAGEFLQKMEATLINSQRNTVGHYHFLTAWYNLLLGNVSSSLIHAEKALNLVIESGAVLPEFLCRLLMAQVLHETKKYEQALTHLSIAGDTIRGLGTSYFEFVCELLSAQFAMDKGEEKNCLESLSKAMTLGKEHEFKTITFFWRKPVMTRLCMKALNAGIEVDYVDSLIRTFNLIPDITSAEMENWPYPLKIYTLGRFGLLKDGKPLRFSGKVRQKPLAMLKAIIAFGGREVSEDQLSDALWPEADGDVAHLSFKTTLHRLRQLIGRDEIIQLKEGRITLDPRYCWVDLWAFQRVAKKVESLWELDRHKGRDDENIKQFIHLSEQALSMYRGDFLPADSMEMWTVSMREKLESKFTRLILGLCRFYERVEQWDKIIESCQRGLAIDDLTEEFYQRLMTCYHQLGRDADAIKVYRRCCKTLNAVMGVEPSPETETVYKRIAECNNKKDNI